MVSWEKNMFFIPNRFFVQHNEMYVSFDISSIPPDMDVLEMNLHVPLPASTVSLHIQVEEIAQGWDVELMKQGYRPAHSQVIQRYTTAAGQQEAIVELLPYEATWRFASINNHGLYVSVSGQAACSFAAEEIPYLVMAIT